MILKFKDDVSEKEVFSRLSHQDPLYGQGKEFILQEGHAFHLNTGVYSTFQGA